MYGIIEGILIAPDSGRAIRLLSPFPCMSGCSVVHSTILGTMNRPFAVEGALRRASS